MKILVTGANGYLGQGVVKALLDNGHSVVEFVVNKSMWYHTGKTVTKFHPEWAKSRVLKAINLGKNHYKDSLNQAAAELCLENEETKIIKLFKKVKEENS